MPIKRLLYILWARIAQSVYLDGPGIESLGGEIFRTRLDRTWGPPSPLYNGYRVFPGGKERPGRGVDHPAPSSAEVKERVALYLYSPSGTSWSVLGLPLPLYQLLPTFVNQLLSTFVYQLVSTFVYQLLSTLVYQLLSTFV